MAFFHVCMLILICVQNASSTISSFLRGNIPEQRPMNIGHRGFSGVYPEHTAPAYSYAIDQGADALECDIVLTRDLQLVCLHESWMSALTNIADLFPEERMNTYFIPDQIRSVTDYFTVDFTLDELEEVVVQQRFSYRDHNHDFEFNIVPFDEYLNIIQASERTVIVYPEVKDPIFQNGLDFVQAANTTIEDILVEILERYGYTSASDPCIVQSFNANSVRYIAEKTDLSVSVLLSPGLPPSNETLEEYAEFAFGIGPNKRLIVTSDLNGRRSGVTDLVQRAHAYGLMVHPWTFRNEDRELLWDYEQDPYLEYLDFLEADIDGLHTDFPGSLDRLLDELYEDEN